MLRHLSLIGALVFAIAPQPSLASIALNATRVILENGKNDASITVRNMGGEILVQSWLDADDGGTASAVQHFTLTPQLVRVRADSEQIVRILYEGVGAPPTAKACSGLMYKKSPNGPTVMNPACS